MTNLTPGTKDNNTGVSYVRPSDLLRDGRDHDTRMKMIENEYGMIQNEIDALHEQTAALQDKLEEFQVLHTISTLDS